MATTLAEVKALVAIPTASASGVTSPILDDTVLQAIIDSEVSKYRTAAAVCRRLASFFAPNFDVSSQSSKVYRSQAYTQWSDMANDFDVRARTEAVISNPVVSGCADTVFPEDQFDNPGGEDRSAA